MKFDKLALTFGPSLVKFTQKINKSGNVIQTVGIIERESIKLVGSLSVSEFILHVVMTIALLALAWQVYPVSPAQAGIAVICSILLIRSYVTLSAMTAYSVFVTSAYGKVILKNSIVRQIIKETVEESAKKLGKEINGAEVYDISNKAAIEIVSSVGFDVSTKYGDQLDKS